jgi:SAM-dependent methyltransferase
MNAITGMRRAVKDAVKAFVASRHDNPLKRAGITGYFSEEDIDRVAEVFFNEGTAPGGRWDPLQHAHMRLPSWFRNGLDPWSPEYAEQQMRLWRLISGVDRPYDPEVDEKEATLHDVDPVRLPGYFIRRDADAVRSASDHIIAGGMIVKHCGLQAGDWALEYGAGFGQTALTLARLGVNVDTVDISRTFCSHVQAQADFFRVPLHAHFGRFGDNPRPGQKYKLIWFYESFHHCLDFRSVLGRLLEHLAPGGRIILCGEPMVERQYAAVPYPWGVRLHSEVVATVRRHHWFELGFSEDFLTELFTSHGLTIERFRCEPTLFGRLYQCEPRPDEIHLGKLWMPPVQEEGWHGQEADGRWTRGQARLFLDSRPRGGHVELDLANPLRRPQKVLISCGAWSERLQLAPGEQRTVRWATDLARTVTLGCPPQRVALLGRLRRGGERLRGVFVRRLRYVPG